MSRRTLYEMVGRDPDRLRQVVEILREETRRWWYTRHLREQGLEREALLDELRSVREKIHRLTDTVYANIVALGDGFVLHYRIREFDSGVKITGHLEGYGGRDAPMIRACLLAGIPVLDFSVPGCDIKKILQIPDEKRPRETAHWHGGTLDDYIRECLAAGAELLNPMCDLCGTVVPEGQETPCGAPICDECRDVHLTHCDAGECVAYVYEEAYG